MGKIGTILGFALGGGIIGAVFGPIYVGFSFILALLQDMETLMVIPFLLFAMLFSAVIGIVAGAIVGAIIGFIFTLIQPRLVAWGSSQRRDAQ